MRRPLRKIIVMTTAVATMWTSAACGPQPGGQPAGPASPTSDGFPVTVGSLTLDQRPGRVVSLAPTATEMLFAVGAGDQVIAVDELSTYPTSAPRTALSGFKPNVEAIADYDPDLVIVSDDIDKIIDQLRSLRIPAHQVPAAMTLDDTYRQITEIGRLTGHAGAAQALVDRMRQDITRSVAGLPKRDRPLTYYYELDTNYYSVTSGTFIGALFTSAGLVNIADSASKDGNRYPQLSAEVIVAANPDLIFLADTKCCGQSRATVGARAGWSGITAVRTGQVIELDDDVASRWGPRVVDLMHAISQAVAAAPAG